MSFNETVLAKVGRGEVPPEPKEPEGMNAILSAELQRDRAQEFKEALIRDAKPKNSRR